MNKPYVKQFDASGRCTNEISKNNPYFNGSPNRKQRNSQFKNSTNNKKGFRVNVLKQLKYVLITQVVCNPKKKATHEVLTNGEITSKGKGGMPVKLIKRWN